MAGSPHLVLFLGACYCSDGSQIQISPASNILFYVDSPSVHPYTPTWKSFCSFLTEHQLVTQFTCFYPAHELNEIFDNMSSCRSSF